ncbi:SDR family oxidoreductase [Micromonospora sp. BRA006-A]|nr:SDR family oxidoreductase [Micromonospora sp. BRA006-A]
MSEDQFTQQHPAEQYGQRDGQPSQRQTPPGNEQEMGPKPDHGEESYRGSDRLTGKRAIITGGDSGIGRAVAIAFAREGADVLITYLADEEERDARETVALIEQAGRTGVAVRCDLREEANCRALVDQALRDPGGVDILVNNAAYQMSQDNGLLDITTEQFDRVFKTNVYAMFWLCKFAVPHMKEGSTIINVVDPGVRPVAAAARLRHHQGGHRQLHQGARAEPPRAGIRVNAVAPGPIWTPLIPATMPEEKVKQFGTDTPLGRPGQPAELAPAYVYFASQESSYVTGEILGVTGGRPTK